MQKEREEKESIDLVFKPNLTLSSNYKANDYGSLYERSKQWQAEKEHKLKVEREQIKDLDLVGCSFRPTLYTASTTNFSIEQDFLRSYASENFHLPNHLQESLQKQGIARVEAAHTTLKLASQKGVIEHLQRQKIAQLEKELKSVPKKPNLNQKPPELG